MNEVFYHIYNYNSTVKQNERGTNAFRGLYLQFKKEGQNFYACYHPHTELGEDSVEKFLSLPCPLKIEHFNSLASENFLLNDLVLGQVLLTRRVENFKDVMSKTSPQVFKIKISPDSFDERVFLSKKILEQNRNHKIRWDFNATANFEFYESLGSETIEFISENIEFIEDPTPYNHEHWLELQKMGLTLASDFEGPFENGEETFSFKILKLSQKKYAKELKSKNMKFVATHSMGPFFEQYLSYQKACSLNVKLDSCGLNFEPLYSDDLGVDLFSGLENRPHVGQVLKKRLDSLNYEKLSVNL